MVHKSPMIAEAQATQIIAPEHEHEAIGPQGRPKSIQRERESAPSDAKEVIIQANRNRSESIGLAEGYRYDKEKEQKAEKKTMH